ncbi:hypothetical protein N7508_003383 [Penicillium antarcticum]|uniref:uncharacterized protein n=1 Tax=Penicillium antarcticum TaxID=416450 RepID=UPI00239C0CA8|nr:uncharacterized protein N7508_003383 [Penicillium antarcticum]KAJ5312553.1 hypothetical protein N7508_003383 [Penicillium antarcticum]
MGQPDKHVEQERIRELSRYYCTFNRDVSDRDRDRDQQSKTHEPEPEPEHEHEHDDNHANHANHEETQPDNDQPPSLRLSTDTTLTALTQLGVHRFTCKRSFVSIIDGKNQHLISEATSTSSLKNVSKHAPNDGLFLGVQTLDLQWGVCPHAIALFTGQDKSAIQDTENITANETRNIIRDFTKEDFYKDRSYVTGWPFFRFYAEVPLYSPGGYVLGSYCVVDDQPRPGPGGFGEDDVAALREIADAIGAHLENKRIVEYHRRSENLVRGLTGFVKCHSKFDPTVSSTVGMLEGKGGSRVNLAGLKDVNGGGETSVSLNMGQDGDAVSSTLGKTSSNGFTRKDSSIFSRDALSASTVPSSITHSSSELSEQASGLDGPTDSSVPENLPISERIAAIFSRASELLKDSLDLDGVVFLDAYRNDPQFEMPAQTDGWADLPSLSSDGGSPITPRPKNTGSSEGILPRDTERFCGFLGHALTPSNGNNDPRLQAAVSEELLHLLITHFPQGHTFTMDTTSDDDCESSEGDIFNYSPPESDIEQHISHRLARRLPGAKSVLFYPLWDWNKSRWLAGALVWAKSNQRPLGMEDLHYFQAFGDSLISEVSRIHWTASENSKFDFLSSVSHELRSPLHGILASAELLQDISLEPAHRDIVKMISTSGQTLLDTMNHLLDFCKINNLKSTPKTTKRTRKRRGRTKDEGTTLVSEFSLANLVEDVIVILHTGRQSPGSLSLMADEETSTSQTPKIEDELSTIIRIEHGNKWIIRSVAGAWRRIVMNLFGNAMKWTQAGLIEISLSTATDQTNPSSSLAHLRVADTGRGIAPEFLKHSAFSPFTQEDALSEGVGLGLSVVHQLVKSLGGYINMKSELGVGTQVDVYIPVQYLVDPMPPKILESPSREATASPKKSLKACLVGFNAYPDLTETPTGILSSDAKRKLAIQSSIAGVLMAQLGWRISLAQSLEKGDGDVAVIEEAAFRALSYGNSSPASLLKHSFRFFIVLGSMAPCSKNQIPPNAILILQPFGPQKICKAAERIKKLYDEQPQVEIPTNAEELPLSSIPQQPTFNLLDGTNTISRQPSAPLVTQSELPISPVLQPKKPILDVNVLIVDDNEINLKILVTFMRKLGCSYHTASNGLIAFEKVESSTRRYDFILMDISMPVMDGLVSTSKIRHHEKENNLNPSCIFAVTGVASDHMQQAAVTAGVDDYLVKPLSLKKLSGLMGIS